MCWGFGGRPGPRLAWLSYFAPAYLRNHRVSVSGVTSEPSSRSVAWERGRPFRASRRRCASVKHSRFSAEHLPQCSNLLLLVRDDRFLLAMNPAGQHHPDRVGGSIPEVHCHASHNTLDWAIRRVERGGLNPWNR